MATPGPSAASDGETGGETDGQPPVLTALPDDPQALAWALRDDLVALGVEPSSEDVIRQALETFHVLAFEHAAAARERRTAGQAMAEQVEAFHSGQGAPLPPTVHRSSRRPDPAGP